MGWVGHAGVGWVIEGLGGSCWGGVCYVGGWVMRGWGGSCRDGVGSHLSD